MDSLLSVLLGAAVLLPLCSFVLILFFGPRMGKSGEFAAYLAAGAIVCSGILSFTSMAFWLGNNWPADSSHHAAHAHDHDSHAKDEAKKEVKKDDHGDAGKHDEHGKAHAEVPPYTGNYWTLGKFGKLSVTISYYIDSLTLVMFCMVTLIASCIHFYAIGYMHDELHDITDKEVTLRDGSHLHRPGRFPRFFQYLSLFCFSMLGLVLAGNIAMVFVFWELVGACSYFLIGFYVERKSASTAANKAFIVNRVGDFGMIIGLMALWSTVGTFAFGDIGDDLGIFSQVRTAANHHALQTPDGMVKADMPDFADQVKRISQDHGAGDPKNATEEDVQNQKSELASRIQQAREKGSGYWLLVVAGIGIFCGCVGKSAQFPLHVWLPDAMEGPTPVSALVHSATMVAAGVYLVGRFFPVFAPETLLVIATVGAITLFIAATIAITANDIKRVLAYSTISQLGYMMLSLGVGGWLAGLMHLVTHAFFKSLLFMCSGSVIHAVHTNDMRSMGGLLKKMPVTAITMLIGCLAIAGVGVPFVIGFSGYYSKDAILEQAYMLSLTNQSAYASIFFVAAAGGAAITSFYMFRMWFMTFMGKPRDAHAYDHAHESPPVMTMPLILLSVFAISVAWDFTLIGYGIVPVVYLLVQGAKRGWFKAAAGGHGDHGHDAHGHDSHGDHGHDAHAHDSHSLPVHHDDHHEGAACCEPMCVKSIIAMLVASLFVGAVLSFVLPSSSLTLKNLLEQARPAGTAADMDGQWVKWTWPNEHTAHSPEKHASVVVPVTLLASLTWIGGIGLASCMYWLGYLNPEDVRRQFGWAYSLLINKWWFDELYDWIFVRPTHVIARMVAGFDRNWLDWIIDGIANSTRIFAVVWEKIADQTIVDGFVNLVAGWTYSFGLMTREVQTGKLRQYVMFIVIGAIAIFVLVSFFWNPTLAR